METTEGVARSPDGAIPLYLQAAQLIRQRIYSGEIRGTLPSETDFAESLQVSSSVIRGALRVLRLEGLIVTQHGVGSRVARIPEIAEVEMESGDMIECRMPLPGERARLDLPQGVPLIVVSHADGSKEIYSSLTTRVTAK